MLPEICWLTGSAIFVLLGSLHLFYTFFTSKLHPRDKQVIDAMKQTPPRLTKETTIWRAWTGFNASHSIGAIFFGLINMLLAFRNFTLIEDSFGVSLLTILTSFFYLWLAKTYWFSIPFISILIAVCCFIASPVLSFFH